MTSLIDNCGEYSIDASEEACSKCLTSYYFKNELDSDSVNENLQNNQS